MHGVLAFLIAQGVLLLLVYAAGALLVGNPYAAVRRRILSTFLLEHFQALARLRLSLQHALNTPPMNLSNASLHDLSDVAKGLDEGRLLGDALAMVPRRRASVWSQLAALVRPVVFFPARCLVSPAEAEILRVGEMSGSLERAIGILLEERRRFGSLRTMFFGALLYPLAVLLIAGAIVAGLLTFIVPKFRKMFEELDVPLPALTRGLIGSGDYAWMVAAVVPYILLGLLVLAFVGANRGRARHRVKDAPGEGMWHWMMTSLQPRFMAAVERGVYWLPFVHSVMRHAHLAEFCREMSMLLRVGVPAPRALRVISDGTMNPWFRDRIRKAADLTESGVDLGRALDEAGLDRRLGWFGRARVCPENAAEAFLRLGEEYATVVHWTASLAAKLIPPILVTLIGMVVGYIVISMFLPLVALTNAMLR